jgi:hypothetical protein
MGIARTLWLQPVGRLGVCQSAAKDAKANLRPLRNFRIHRAAPLECTETMQWVAIAVKWTTMLSDSQLRAWCWTMALIDRRRGWLG